jgi:PPK2 family polyphosphate:nucleotide phosphotransferase
VVVNFEQRYRVDPIDFKIADAKTHDGKAINKSDASKIRDADLEALDDLQERLYAEGKQSLLIVFQALDAGGKDSTIEHVMSGVNPQGVRVASFKQPSLVELKHDFLWRCQRALPPAGDIGIFNRSHYEDVLITRVHPELLEARGIDPKKGEGDELWQRRFDSICAWERHLADSGTQILKFFLHVSRKEQRERLLARAERPEKNWKFSVSDVDERQRYDDYQHAFEQALRGTATPAAPWYAIPADQKWLMRTAVASIIRTKLEAMDPQYPRLTVAQRTAMDKAVARLKAED